MISNLNKYKKDLDRLILNGGMLLNAIQYENLPEEFEKQVKKVLKGKKYNEFVEKLPSFREEYQSWYSEALALIKFLLPDRYNDFIRLYEKPKNRKKVSYVNYTIEDCLQGLVITKLGKTVVGSDAAIPLFQQQLNIVKSAKGRFESSLFDIQQMARADLFDSEMDKANELLKNGFLRAAGVVAGVVLEKHLSQVCLNHNIKIKKKNPHISDLNDELKRKNVVDVPNWRFIQRLGDLRNLCMHNKEREPTRDEVEELLKGVEKVIKTLF